MSRSTIIAVLVIVALAAFVVSGWRWREILPTTSGYICGPLTDQYGNPAGDAGPCPSFASIPPQGNWVWAPWWESTN